MRNRRRRRKKPTAARRTDSAQRNSSHKSQPPFPSNCFLQCFHHCTHCDPDNGHLCETHDHAGITLPSDVSIAMPIGIFHHCNVTNSCYCLFPNLTSGADYLNSPATYQSFLSPPKITINQFFDTPRQRIADEKSRRIASIVTKFMLHAKRTLPHPSKLQQLAYDLFDVIDAVVDEHYRRSFSAHTLAYRFTTICFQRPSTSH